MDILALETTERTGSLALASSGKVRESRDLPPHQRSAQSIAPAIAQLLADIDCPPTQVDLIAVTIGPGSFTGLRVGVATARALAYATGAEVLGVDTHEAIAAGPDILGQIPAGAKFWVAIDAQRGDAVVRPFQVDPDGWPRPTADATMLPLAEWLARLPMGTQVTGPVFRKSSHVIPPHVHLMPPETRRATAWAVARLAIRDHAAGRRDDLWSLAPRYSRRSAAEEKRDGV